MPWVGCLWLEISFCTYWSHMDQQAKGNQNVWGKVLQRSWLSLPSHNSTHKDFAGIVAEWYLRLMLQIWREYSGGLGDQRVKNTFSETFICLTSICVLFYNSPCSYHIKYFKSTENKMEGYWMKTFLFNLIFLLPTTVSLFS